MNVSGWAQWTQPDWDQTQYTEANESQFDDKEYRTEVVFLLGLAPNTPGTTSPHQLRPQEVSGDWRPT